jgi:hypothetical protein
LTGPAGPTGPQGPAGADGATGPQGPIGLTGTAGTDGNTVLNGTSAPTGSTGVDGDFYINTATNLIYGPKSGGTWPAGVSLVGPAGSAGSAWQTNGNALAGSEVEFLGTTDASNLNIKVNNQRAGRIDFSGSLSLGYQANPTNLTGSAQNTALGFQVLNQNQTAGTKNTGMGYRALYTNSTGEMNTAAGHQALMTNSTGVRNTALGTNALYFSSTGSFNTAVGSAALSNNSGGNDNTAVGVFTLINNLNANANTAVGKEALFSTAADNNTAVGYRALYSNSGGVSNTAVGMGALQGNNSGTQNTAIGASALNTNTTGTLNTAVGESSNVTAGNFINSSVFGYQAVADASNKVRIGNASVTSIGGQVGWTTFSDSRVKSNVQHNVPGLQFIRELKPVTYTFNRSAWMGLMGVADTLEWEGKHDIETMVFSGFLAQDVIEAAKKSGYAFSGIDQSGTLLGLRYAEFVVPITQSILELDTLVKQQSEQIQELQRQNDALYQQLILIQQRLNALESR